MVATTTYYTPPPFTWSYSRLKNFEVCPKKHLEVDIKKSAQEQENEGLLWGNTAHKALADRISKNTPLPPGLEPYETWAKRVVTGQGNILVEQQLAITSAFEPCAWFRDKRVWFRGIVDVLQINGPVALAIDWKTGKILEDSVQLALFAQCIFSHHPTVQAVRSEFVWLKDDAVTREDFYRRDMPGLWRALWPRIEALKVAHDTQTYPAKPGGLCKRHCPVASCAYHGKGTS